MARDANTAGNPVAAENYLQHHILDAASHRAFDEDGSTHSRIDLTLVRTYILGDRWQGSVSISDNSVHIVTDLSLGGHDVALVTIDARNP